MAYGIRHPLAEIASPETLRWSTYGSLLGGTLMFFATLFDAIGL